MIERIELIASQIVTEPRVYKFFLFVPWDEDDPIWFRVRRLKFRSHSQHDQIICILKILNYQNVELFDNWYYDEGSG